MKRVVSVAEKIEKQEQRLGVGALPRVTERVIAYKMEDVMSTENEVAVWKSIDSAKRVMGYEIIAASFGWHPDGVTPMCEKSPFVSFWMQHSGKFYNEPTHWLCRLPIEFPRVDRAA